MESASVHTAAPYAGRPKTDAYVADNGDIVVPDGINLSSLLNRNIDDFGDLLAYRYVDYSQHSDGKSSSSPGIRWAPALEPSAPDFSRLRRAAIA
jgi:hypothetical protein